MANESAPLLSAPKQKSLYYKMDGTPYAGRYALIDFAVDFRDFEGRRVGFTDLGQYSVSTVWVGFDMSYGMGKPLIFETMVFPKDSDRDLDRDRYASLEEAKVGHERMVSRWKKKIS